MLPAMQRGTITSAGQLSVPATVRRRWDTRAVLIEDHGDHLVVWPVPADPIAALRGAMKERIRHSSDELRRMAREDERHAEESKLRRLGLIR